MRALMPALRHLDIAHHTMPSSIAAARAFLVNMKVPELTLPHDVPGTGGELLAGVAPDVLHLKAASAYPSAASITPPLLSHGCTRALHTLDLMVSSMTVQEGMSSRGVRAIHDTLKSLLADAPLRVLKLPCLPPAPPEAASAVSRIEQQRRQSQSPVHHHLSSGTLEQLWLFSSSPSDVWYLRHPADFPRLRELRVTNRLHLPSPAAAEPVRQLVSRLTEFPLELSTKFWSGNDVCFFFQLFGDGLSAHGLTSAAETMDMLRSLAPLRDRLRPGTTLDLQVLDLPGPIGRGGMRAIAEAFPNVRELCLFFEDDEAGEARMTPYGDTERGLVEALQHAPHLRSIVLCTADGHAPHDLFAAFACAGRLGRPLDVTCVLPHAAHEESASTIRHLWDAYRDVALPSDVPYFLHCYRLDHDV